MNKQAIIIAGTAVVSAAAGGVGGYFFAKKRVTDSLNAEYNQRMEEEIERTRNHYMAMSKKGDYADPGELVKKLHRETAEHFSTEDSTLQRVAEGLAQSLGYTGPEEDEDWEIQAAREQALLEDSEELTVPEFDAPYLISRDEFVENEKGYAQESWVWFVMDNTLMNESKEPVDDVASFIGDNALNRMGQGGSKDPNAVYVRNNSLEMDFMILRHRGTYEEEVGPRLRARDRRPGNRFRPDSDD
jgi:hypothetical protein